MRCEDVYVAGVGSYYPSLRPVEDAIRDGHYDAASQRRTHQQSVAVAGGRPGEDQPDMAVRAGRTALHRGGLATDEVGLLLHAVAVYAGLDGWNCASYLQDRLLDGGGLAFEIRQVSNGAVGALELAVPFMQARATGSAALITASERFAPPVWNRWRADAGLIFGDGASALLLSRRKGFAKLLSVATESASELEGLHRGEAPFQSGPDPAAFPLNLAARAVSFVDEMGSEKIHEIGAQKLRRAGERAAADAGMTLAETTAYAVPNFGRSLLERQVLEPLDAPLERTTHDWGARTGHVGAADQFGGFDHLVNEGRVGPGDRVMLVGVGGGFNYTCAVIEILRRPGWGDKL